MLFMCAEGELLFDMDEVGTRVSGCSSVPNLPGEPPSWLLLFGGPGVGVGSGSLGGWRGLCRGWGNGSGVG